MNNNLDVWKKKVNEPLIVPRDMAGLAIAQKERRAVLKLQSMETEINNLKKEQKQINSKLDKILFLLQDMSEK